MLTVYVEYVTLSKTIKKNLRTKAGPFPRRDDNKGTTTDNRTQWEKRNMTKNRSEKTDSVKPKKLNKALLRGMIGLLLAGLAAGGWLAYTHFFQSDYPKAPLSYVDLDDTVLRFTWSQLPQVYAHMVSANAELDLMENEIDRIRRVGKAYPRQAKIVAPEIKRWEKNVHRLSGQLRRFQGQAEALYVTFRVNPEKGRNAIREKGQNLASSMQEVIADVRGQTAPLKKARVAPDGVKGVISKIKNRFF